MLQNILPNLVIYHYLKNILYSHMIQVPPLVLRTYHLIMSYKHGTFNA